MSLLATAGGSFASAASSWISKALGANNRSAMGDCLDISDVGSYAAKLARYPQCAPYISASGPLGSGPVSPSVPLQPTATPGFMNVGYEPAMATVPKLAAPLLRALPGAGTALVSAGRTALSIASTGGTRLQRLAAKYPAATGIAAGFLIDSAGNWILSPSGKRVSAKHRHINPLNVHALRRSIRRVKAARHICSQVDKIAGPRHRRSSARRCAPKCR